MLGPLQDAGNITTLPHYLELLAAAGMVTGLHKYAGDAARSRASSPKLQVYNNALLTAAFKPQRSLLIGGDGIAVETFLLRPVSDWAGG